MTLAAKILLIIIIGVGTPIVASHYFFKLLWSEAAILFFPCGVSLNITIVLTIWAEEGERQRINELLGKEQ